MNWQFWFGLIALVLSIGGVAVALIKSNNTTVRMKTMQSNHIGHLEAAQQKTDVRLNKIEGIQNTLTVTMTRIEGKLDGMKLVCDERHKQ